MRQLRAGLQKQRILVQEAVEEPFLWWPPFLPSPYLKLIAAEANLVQVLFSQSLFLIRRFIKKKEFLSFIYFHYLFSFH